MDDETDPAPASAAEALSIIGRQRRLAQQTVPSSALLFLVWGSAWLVGYGGLWLSSDDDGPTAPAAVLAGASDEVLGLAANSIAALVVGLLYLAGGAMWRATGMYVLGAWIALVGAGSAYAGMPDSYLWLSLAGGGGMLAAGLVELVRGRRATP
jgi:hypothetical protein